MSDFFNLVRKINNIQNDAPVDSSVTKQVPQEKKAIMETTNILKEFDRISTDKRIVANPRIEEDDTNEDLLGDLHSRYANFLNPSAVVEDDEEEDAVMAQAVADQIMDMAGMMGLTNEHQYVQGHVDAIKERTD